MQTTFNIYLNVSDKLFIPSEVTLSEYGGYYYAERADGSIQVKLPGSHEFFCILPDYEVFTRYVDQCNIAFADKTPGLTLHLTGCKRCAKSLSNTDFFSPCTTGSEIIAQSKVIAQEISKEMAKQWVRWHDRISSDGSDVTEGPT